MNAERKVRVRSRKVNAGNGAVSEGTIKYGFITDDASLDDNHAQKGLTAASATCLSLVLTVLVAGKLET